MAKQVAARSKRKLVLRLYVAGNAPNSVRAIANTQALCNQHFPANHELEIIDLLQHPRRALADQIIVTPTLLKLAPRPAQRFVGNLNDSENLLLGMFTR